MKFHLDKNAGRFGRGGLQSYSLMFIWFALAGIVHFINLGADHEIILCPFKKLTGHPCATCGMTRSAVALLKGNLTEATAINPLATILLIILILWSGFRLLTGMQINLSMGKLGRRIFVAVILLSLAVNWWYVIAFTDN